MSIQIPWLPFGIPSTGQIFGRWSEQSGLIGLPSESGQEMQGLAAAMGDIEMW